MPGPSGPSGPFAARPHSLDAGPDPAVLAALVTGLRAAVSSLDGLVRVVEQLDRPPDLPRPRAGPTRGFGAEPGPVSSPVAGPAVVVSAARAAAGDPVPPWLADADARWQRARHALLAAARAGADDLRQAHARYADSGPWPAVGPGEVTSSRTGDATGRAAAGHTPRCEHGVENEPALWLDIAGRPTVALRPEQLPGGLPGPGQGPASDTVPAAQWWAEPVRVCGEALHALEGAGRAGTVRWDLIEPYRTWLQGHRYRWQALHHDAITVLDALRSPAGSPPAPRLAVDILDRLHRAPLRPPRAVPRYPSPSPSRGAAPAVPAVPAARPGVDAGSPRPQPPPHSGPPGAFPDPEPDAEPEDRVGASPRAVLRLTAFGGFALEQRIRPETGRASRPGRASWEPVADLHAKARELLLFLAAHPEGVGLAPLLATLWPNVSRKRHSNALHTTLTRIRRALNASQPPGTRRQPPGSGSGSRHQRPLIGYDGSVYGLDPSRVEVDYWSFLHAAQITRDTRDPRVRVSAAHTMTDLYQGHFAADVTGRWPQTPRSDAHDQHLGAVLTLVEHYTRHDPDRVLGVLQPGRNLHPGDERLAAAIMRVHAEHAHPDRVTAAFDTLVSQLAALGARPSPEIRELHRRLLTAARRGFTGANPI